MILVVDDHADTRFVLHRLLTLDGYEALAVASGGEALGFLSKYMPKLVILDYSMPDMNGLMVFKQMKADPRLKAIPVIMFSANADDVKDEAIAAGIDAYIEKSSLDWILIHKEIARLAGPPTRSPRAPEDHKQKELG
jgi:CheY-like chemotaxis protein